MVLQLPPSDRTRLQLSAENYLCIDIESGGMPLAMIESDCPVRVLRGESLFSSVTDGETCLYLPNRYVSRKSHCLIEPVNTARVRVTDTGSTNGIRLNGSAVNDREVARTPCVVEAFPFALNIRRELAEHSTVPLRTEHPPQPALTLDPITEELSLPGGQLLAGLTPYQASLLRMLVERHPRWTTSAELAHLVGGTTAQSIYNQIHQIRRHLETLAPGGAALIASQRGRGYALLPHATS